MLTDEMERLLRYYGAYSAHIGRRMVGCEELAKRMFISLMIGGNILLEGPPGVGKTSLAKTFAEFLSLAYSRIQFTPDLMPLDIIGSNILQQGEGGRRQFEFYKGPLFANVVLGDEINRATPKTQSAFLEAMEEKRVTFLGTEYRLPDPFMVIATQNPIELEGTYPLPEAQIDRFLMKLYFGYPDFGQLKRIVAANELPPQAAPTAGTTGGTSDEVHTLAGFRALRALENEVIVLEDIRNYIARLVVSTHPAHSEVAAVKQYVMYGASPRAGISLLRAAKWKALVENRVNVSFADVAELAFDVLNHRIILNFAAESESVDLSVLIRGVVQHMDQRFGTRR